MGRRHLTARPRPPRVRGGGSVCSVTNGPSRPARPLARARRGPARECSSRRLRGPRQPPRALLAPSTEACPRRSRRETGPRWRAACLPAGECAVWAWDAAERVQGRRASPRLWTRVRAMRRLSLQSESEVSLHLNLLLRLPRVGGSSESLALGAGGKGFRKLLP